MIYIYKANLPESLSEYAKTQIESNLMPLYDGKWDKKEFRDKIAKEQHYLCCYCNNLINLETGKQQEINGKNAGIEHFQPFTFYQEERVSYFNLFLVCRHSENKPEKFGHCDSGGGKAEKIIPKYISHPECETFFAYNFEGEILPYCKFKSIENCIKNYRELNDEQKMVLATIDVLKLNVPSLTQQRKSIYEVCEKQIQEMSLEKMLQEVENYYQKKVKFELERFCGVYFYLLQRNIERKGDKKQFDIIVKKWRDSFISSSRHTVITHKLA